MCQSGRPLLRNVYNKNAYFSSNGVKTSAVAAETNTFTTAASETGKLKDSTWCLLDRPADGYNRQIQTEANCKLQTAQRLQNKVLRTIGDCPGRTPVRDLRLAFQFHSCMIA
jgi:hypothetical protein